MRIAGLRVEGPPVHRQPDVDVIAEAEVRGQNAHHRAGNTVHDEKTAQDILASAEPALPETV